jgi:hypothetical protein
MLESLAGLGACGIVVLCVRYLVLDSWVLGISVRGEGCP